MPRLKRDKFELFRLSLLERSEPSLFAKPENREKYLRRMFGAPRTFEHYSSTYHYVPHPELQANGAIIGAIGRSVESDENTPPGEGLTETKREVWKASVFVLDPTDHEDGQKAAFEIDSRVGGANALICALVNSINKENDTLYVIEVKPIFNVGSFWAWAKKNEGNVTEIIFDVVAPNGLFNTNNTLKDELRTTRQQTGAEEVVIGLRSDEGLKTDSPPIIDAVEYTEKSGGKIKGKAPGAPSFNSSKSPRTTRILSEEQDTEPLLARAARLVSKILDRE